MAARVAAVALGALGVVGQLLPVPIDELRELARQQPEAAEPTQDGFVHPTLCDSSVHQTAGYIEAAKGPGAPKYFFWLFESKSEPENDPLIMWLSGGPGCSSQLALFAENGPCSVSKDGSSTIPNPHSWHQKANVIWVDQPAGVGFSTGLGTHNEQGVGDNMFVFLQGFYKQFPQYQSTKFFIFGESYAGHYVPAIAHRIYEGNHAGEGLKIPMAGIAIGNGLTNPEIQYAYYAEMGHFGGRAEGGHAPAGVIGDAAYKKMKAATPGCIAAIHACNADASINGLNNTACNGAFETCNLMAQIPYEATGKNVYDMRIPCEHGRLCYDFDMITTYLNSKDVQSKLGVHGKWGSCNMAVNMLFQAAGDWMVNLQTKIPDLLHEGLEVLIYAGDCDYICNWLGNKAWTKALKWDGADEFNKAEDHEWQVGGTTVAKHRSAQHFHFMQVYEAGHMVPMDKPAESLAMVNAFITGTLSDNEKPTALVV
jgi:carboxypeptidase C (cathepsin A)